MSSASLRIATRASALALWQARYVADALLRQFPALSVELVELTTAGDQDREQPLHQLGGVGVFTREVQAAVLDRRADLAVHSLKDLPTESLPSLVLAAVPPRAPPFDRLVWPRGYQGPAELESFAPGARIGTGSLRRQAQLRHARPDLHLVNIRGNVETRLRKLDAGDCDALVLAEAGLERLALLAGRITGRLEPPLMFPAVGQGALGIECRADDDAVRKLLAALDDAETRRAVTAERTLLAELRAGCHAPVGVHARREADRLTLAAVVLSPDGQQRVQAEAGGPADRPDAVGRAVAAELRRQGADELIRPATR